MIRILFVADSHLGLDLPRTPRVERRRRGHDFLANHAAALGTALDGSIDLVIHGGDIFDRPAVAPELARLAYEPLLRLADAGVPVFIVPGNHERSRLPHARFLAHRRIRVFDRPRTFEHDVRGVRIALAGFPYERTDVRTRFPGILESTGWQRSSASLRLLCVHHCVEGATVGPGDFVFRSNADVIRTRDVPDGFAAVLSGHIHRHQVLTRSLSGRPLRVPVIYPGSIERTATAEIGEAKGYVTLELEPETPVRWTFHELPARPMFAHTLPSGDPDGMELDGAIRAIIAAAPPDAVVRIRVEGPVNGAHLRVISAARIRGLAPATMNVDVVAADIAQLERSRTTEVRTRAPRPELQLDLEALTTPSAGGSRAAIHRPV